MIFGKLQRAHPTLQGHFAPAYLVGSNMLRAYLFFIYVPAPFTSLLPCNCLGPSPDLGSLLLPNPSPSQTLFYALKVLHNFLDTRKKTVFN